MWTFNTRSIGGQVRWHRTASHLETDPHTGVGLWIAWEVADRTKGCLQVAPGNL